jgi:hypothetical protein
VCFIDQYLEHRSRQLAQEDFCQSPVHFRANGNAASYRWVFGGGSIAEGRDIDRAFDDAEGGLRDGPGRFRVILRTADVDGTVRWDARAVSLGSTLSPAKSGDLVVPETGGYTFHLIANDPTKLVLDGDVVLESPSPKPQVCDSGGNMAQVAVRSIGVAAGVHTISGTEDPQHRTR